MTHMTKELDIVRTRNSVRHQNEQWLRHRFNPQQLKQMGIR